MADRPSFLRVDRWALERDEARLAELDGEMQAHVREVRRDLPVPDWVRALERPTPRRRPWWWTLGVATAAAAVLVLVLVPRPSYVGVKGELRAELYLEGGPWEGQPIPVGEPLRVVLRGPEAAFYAVLLEEGGDATVVSRGAWPDGGVIPGAWAFDAPPVRGSALVVLALDEDPADRSAEALERDAVHRDRVPLP